MWSKLSVIIFGSRKDNKHASIFLKWHLNRGNFQDQVTASFQHNSHECVCEVNTYQSTIEHICVHFESAASYSIDDNSHVSD